jgi:hypothetical protein
MDPMAMDGGKGKRGRGKNRKFLVTHGYLSRLNLTNELKLGREAL